MKKQEIESKLNENVKDFAKYMNGIKENVEEIVAKHLGEDWKAEHISHRGFRVALYRNGESVFGCDFEIMVQENFERNEDGSYAVSLHVTASTGSCGSFEICKSGDHEEKYLAFAKFLTAAKNCLLDKFLLVMYEKCQKLLDERYQLQAELNTAE